MRYSKSELKKIHQTKKRAVQTFVCLLLVGTLTGSIFFMRPSTSTVEKRELTPFPSFTFSDFIDGTYFSNITTWYADTYPGRDRLVAWNQTIQSTYGIESNTMMVSSSNTEKEAKVPTSNDMQAEVQNQIMDQLYVEDGAAYSMYYFNKEAADIYTKAINHAANELDGTTNVYSILVPNNSGAVLDEDVLKQLGGADQQEAISYYYNSYNDKVTSVKTIETLREHRDDYIYFRTDHHWTPKGAYYVYQNFCKEKGIKSHALSSFKKSYTFKPFLGTFYSQLQLSSMEKNPDYVKAYVPNGTNKMTYWDTEGNKVDHQVITDVSDWDQASGYYCFIGGDKPLSVIKNPKIKDGSSCLVLKESYGNSFIPYLVDHYSTVYIMDFRYTDKNVIDYCKEHKIDDLIVMNNITIIGSEDVAGRIARELK